MTGKTDNPAYAAAIDDYARRINRYLPLEVIIIPDLKNTRNMPCAVQKEKEGELILRTIRPGDCCTLLDERGRAHTSEGFAAYLEGRMQAVQGRLVFVVGGPYGFSQSVYRAAADMISLSSMTFSHQMIRLLFAEQLYRALTIINGDPYHHG